MGAVVLALWSVVAAYDTAALVRASDVVVHGQVLDVRSRWDRTRTRIFTEVTVRVGEPWKGTARAGAPLVVRQPGGSVDGIGMRQVGQAELRPGEEVVLFLSRLPRGPAYRVVGMAMGKYAVERRPGAPPVAVFDAAGLAIRGQAPAAALPLDELRARVRAAAEAR